MDQEVGRDGSSQSWHRGGDSFELQKRDLIQIHGCFYWALTGLRLAFFVESAWLRVSQVTP